MQAARLAADSKINLYQKAALRAAPMMIAPKWSRRSVAGDDVPTSRKAAGYNKRISTK